MMRRPWIAPLLAALLLALPAEAAAPLRVFAASSLTEALGEVADLYAAAGHPRPVLVFAASSALARQIEAGAPAGLFLSADEAWMDELAARGRLVKGTRCPLLSNRLALIVPANRARRVAIGLGFDFAGLIGDGRWTTGDPDAVPVGRYARAALTKLGVWASVERRLVRAENARMALAYVERGDVAAGIVYVTDAKASAKVAVAGLFPASSHPPIVYPVAQIAPASPAARAFESFLGSMAARAVFARHGFIVDESWDKR